ncbi:MAG: hypothetical protein EP330_04035, partial [Deltaproteobacteria bacterium]
VYADISGYEADEATCDGEDNDCDGDVDTDIASAPAAAEQDGVCSGAVQVCNGTSWVEPDATALAAQFSDYEATEVSCDSLDNDCNGVDDDIASPDAPDANKTLGVCAGSKKECVSGSWTEPDYTALANYEPLEESCDSLDNDCDGNLDFTWEVDPNSSTLECWGLYVRSRPEQVDPGPWKSVTLPNAPGAGNQYACAIDTNDQLFCWGNYEEPMTADVSWYSSFEPVAFNGGGSWSMVEGGNAAACGIQTDGTLWCWGIKQDTYATEWGALNQMASGTWATVDLGDRHACAIDDNNGLWCWGTDRDGSLGLDTAGNRELPEQISWGSWADVSLGYGHTCALETDGSLWCWGRNLNYSAGGQASTDPVTATAITHPTAGTWTEVQSGMNSNCAMDSAGEIWCWGDNSEGQLGDGNLPTDNPIPQQVTGGPWDALHVGYRRVCADKNGELWCWGSDSTRRMGTGGAGDTDVPLLVDDQLGDGNTSLSVWSNCAIEADDGSLWCWGEANSMVTGSGPERMTWRADVAVSHLDVDEPAGCYIDSADDSLWCLGGNENDAMGDGTSLDSAFPVPIMAGTAFSDLGIGRQFGCALDNSGNRWCWGLNDRGQVGNGTVTTQSVPVMDADRTYTALDAGRRHACAIDTAGVLWCWGYLGNNNSVPVKQQDSTETWTDVFAGMDFTCALDASNDLACWGTNGFNQLGDGSGVYALYANRVVHTGPWRAVSLGANHMCAVKTDDSLWCWGRGSSGQLGQGNEDDAPTPVQVPGTWSSVTSGDYHTCALDTASHPWCWGAITEYQMARVPEPGEYEVYVPEQVDAGTWSALDAGSTRTCGTRALSSLQQCTP